MAKKTAKKAAKKTVRKAAKKAASKKKTSKSTTSKKPVATGTRAAAAAASGVLEPGALAPAFTLRDQSGVARSLSDYAGKPLILYFYPKDDTEDCTAEACAFNDRLPALAKTGAAVLGISRLDVKSKAKFAAKHGITFPLLADEQGEVASTYGTWVEKSMYGKKFMAVSRTTYLIDSQGRVARRWDKVEVEGHANDVTKALAALK